MCSLEKPQLPWRAPSMSDVQSSNRWCPRLSSGDRRDAAHRTGVLLLWAPKTTMNRYIHTYGRRTSGLWTHTVGNQHSVQWDRQSTSSSRWELCWETSWSGGQHKSFMFIYLHNQISAQSLVPCSVQLTSPAATISGSWWHTCHEATTQLPQSHESTVTEQGACLVTLIQSKQPI